MLQYLKYGKVRQDKGSITELKSQLGEGTHLRDKMRQKYYQTELVIIKLLVL